MKFTRITASNFLSYKELEFDFRPGLTLLSGWNADQQSANGAGKSAILDAICFALFGKTPRDVKLDELILQGEKSMTCSLEMQHGENTITVSRGRGPNFLDVKVDGKTVIGQDLNDTQSMLCNKFNLDYQVFLNSVYFAQSQSGQFLMANDESRKEILLDILGMDVFEKAYTSIKDTAKSLVNDLIVVKSQMEQIKSSIESSKTKMSNLTDGASSFDQNKARDLDFVKKEIEQIESDISTCKRDLVDSTYDANGYSERHTRYIAAVEMNDRLKKIMQEQPRVFSKCSAIKDKILQSKANLKSFFTNTCPTCSQKLPANNDLVAIETEAVKKNTAELQALKNTLVQLEAFISVNGENIENELHESKMELERYSNMKGHVDSITTRLNSLNGRKKSLTDQLIELEGRENDYEKLILDERASLMKAASDLKKTSEKMLRLEKDVAYYDVVKDVFGPHGVRAAILDSIISNLNARSKRYLDDLFGGSLQLKFCVETATTKTASKQKITAVVTKDGKEISLHSLSGGEKRHIIVSVDFALSDVTCTRSNHSFDLMVLDEITEGMDAAGREKLFGLLEQLGRNKSIIVVDHSCEFKSMFNRVVSIEKRNGISEIKK